MTHKLLRFVYIADGTMYEMIFQRIIVTVIGMVHRYE